MRGLCYLCLLVVKKDNSNSLQASLTMFLDALSKVGASTVSIPITVLRDSTGNIVSTIGVGVPASAVSHLDKLGYSHDVTEKISKTIFEDAGKTLTGHWMDATGQFKSIYPEGVSVGWHRMQGHHFLTDGIRAFEDSNLSAVDFYKHLATDVVTKNGLPILPESIVRSLASTLEVTPTQIMPWVSMNILDIGASVFAITHTATNVTTIVYGTAEWGLGYAANTIGIGALEVVSGVATQNPILIGAGAVDVACGSVTAYKYYTQPFFCGVPVGDILSSSLVGASFAAALAGVEILITRKQKKMTTQVPMLAERIGTAGLLSGLSAIAAPLSITTGFGIVGYKLAKVAGESTNEYIQAMPITGHLSKQIDDFIIENYVGEEKMNKIKKYLE